MHLGFLDCPIGMWVQSYGAWRKPALSGALFRLLLGSWQQVPCATLPDSNEFLSVLAEMPLDEFFLCKPQLLNGFALENGRWVCPQLADRAKSLTEQHAESLSRMAASVTATVVAPDVFSLRMEEQTGETKLRRRRMPAGFAINSQLLGWGVDYFGRAAIAQAATRSPTQGEVLVCLNAILVELRLDAASNSRLYADWDAAFMNFVTRQTNGTYGLCSKYLPDLFPNVLTPIANSSRVSVATRQEKVRQSTQDALSGALSIINGGAGAQMIDINAPLRARAA